MRVVAAVFAGVVLGAFLAAGPAAAQVAVVEIKAQLFLERSGALSDNLVGANKVLRNTVIGEGDAGEPAESVLLTLVFSGKKNSVSSNKIARDLATLTVRQQARTGERILLKRAFGGFLFGETGRISKAVLLDNATCAPLEIEVKVGRAAKTAKLDFSCGE